MTVRMIMAEFSTADALVSAVRELVGTKGPHRFETYSPYALSEIDDVLSARGAGPSKVRTIMVVAAICGALAAFFLQYWSSVVAYPFNSGGRPYNAWPAFMMVTFEITIISAAIGGFLTMIIGSNLPRLNHRVFDWEGFERASDDRFFLEIELRGDQEADGEVRAVLDRYRPITIQERGDATAI
ncbi:DUF3341 domain-containing protein [Jiella marina]|uniref:DUF3341 domain-containing protein n=1 Tax=Jiella sp. LLJ827 TaxID=2917712 RepID=UPI002100D460|nr:DUF3341 domain-containing protein [Jiella sp. LLJ827]MCQ0987078.1 DUF3341 domain-containing protein [Jiella sp. LLJ827]